MRSGHPVGQVFRRRGRQTRPHARQALRCRSRQSRAFRVIDNRTSELTSWDTDLLPDALAGLGDLDIFSFDDVLPLAATAGKTDPDDIPETPKNPVSRVGDIRTLGKHRLMCGDATKPEHVERLLDGAKPDLMVTDPPYGVNYDASWRDGLGYAAGRARGASTNDDRCDWTDAYALFPGSIAYAWMSSLALPVATRGLDACGFIRRSLIIWDKGHIVPSRRSLQLETRVVLVRRQEGRESQLAGRAQSLDPLGDRQPPENLRRATRPKSLSSVCSGPFIITGATSTIRSSGLARRS